MIQKKTTKDKVLKLVSCKRCGHCCRMTSGFVLEKEIKQIAKALGKTEEKVKEETLDEVTIYAKKLFRPKQVKKGKPYGRCILFDEEKGCTIHEDKPLFCRISSCNEHGDDLSQWFMLNYVVDETNPQSVREWAVFVRQNKPIKGGTLKDLVPDEKILKKMLNYEVLR